MYPALWWDFYFFGMGKKTFLVNDWIIKMLRNNFKLRLKKCAKKFGKQQKAPTFAPANKP
jgi:hypothetical protein